MSDMDDSKASPSNTANAGASSDLFWKEYHDASQKKTDSTFLDLGWGLEDIGVSNPYRRKYITLAYTTSSLIISVLIIAIPSFIPVVILSVINAVFQCGVFLYCSIKFKWRETRTSKRKSIEKKLSMSIDHDSPKAARYKDRSYFSIEPSLAREYSSIKQERFEKEFSCENSNSKSGKACHCLLRFRDFCASFDEAFGRGDDPTFLRPYFFRFHAVLYGVVASLFTLSV
eukprot:769537_1